MYVPEMMTSSPAGGRANRLPASNCLLANETSVFDDDILLFGYQWFIQKSCCYILLPSCIYTCMHFYNGIKKHSFFVLVVTISCTHHVMTWFSKNSGNRICVQMNGNCWPFIYNCEAEEVEVI